MTDITIPPEALEAGRHAVNELRKRYEFPTSLMLASAACIAMLKAWPGAIHNGHWLLFPHTKLPLPTENTNAE